MYLNWTFASLDPTAAVRSRRRLAATLRELEIETGLIEAVELVYGELLSNCVRHAPGPVAIQVRSVAAGIEIEVEDCGRGVIFDDAALPAATCETGRGLWLVKSVARSVRVEQTETGQRIVAAVG